MVKRLREAVGFFKEEPSYQKLFEQFRKKFESLGRIGGTISVRHFSEEELTVIGGFFGITAEQLKVKDSISMLAFEKQLEKTKFSGLGMKELLDEYFGEVLLSKKEKKYMKEKKLHNLFQELSEAYPRLEFWFRRLAIVPRDGRWIVRFAEERVQQFRQNVAILAEGYHHLPKKPERLPVFSQKVAGDPHAFDVNRDLGKMFLHVLTLDLWMSEKNLESESLEGEGVVVPTDTESINELLTHFHLFRDDLLNFVTCSGFLAETKEGLDHPVFRSATEWNTVFHIPLRELILLNCVYPAKGKDVWVVENSGVCSTLLDLELGLPIISTNGQFKLAGLMLLDLLVEKGCTIHYAGDFDPEGLSMAQRLLNRYPENVELWHMDLNSYNKTNPVKSLDSERLAKLDGIIHEELLEVADEMRRKAKAGYQEALVKDMKNDLMTNVKEP